MVIFAVLWRLDTGVAHAVVPFPGRPERCSLLARFKLALPCEVPRRVSRSLGSRFWFKNTTRGTPWAVRPLAR